MVVGVDPNVEVSGLEGVNVKPANGLMVESEVVRAGGTLAVGLVTLMLLSFKWNLGLALGFSSLLSCPDFTTGVLENVNPPKTVVLLGVVAFGDTVVAFCPAILDDEGTVELEVGCINLNY